GRALLLGHRPQPLVCTLSVQEELRLAYNVVPDLANFAELRRVVAELLQFGLNGRAQRLSRRNVARLLRNFEVGKELPERACADLSRLGRLRHHALQNALSDGRGVDLRQQPDELLLSLRRLDRRHLLTSARNRRRDTHRVVGGYRRRSVLYRRHAGQDAGKLRERLLLTLTREQRLALNLTLQSLLLSLRGELHRVRERLAEAHAARPRSTRREKPDAHVEQRIPAREQAAETLREPRERSVSHQWTTS